MGVAVEIYSSLEESINKKFKGKSPKILKFLKSLEENHHKEKLLTQIGGVAIKEIKYERYRFYYTVDNYRLKLFDKGELDELLLKFIRMSNKKTQQHVINSIKDILRNLKDR